MPDPLWNFALLDEEDRRYETARAVVLPLPFERTTSYGKGTAAGPEAIVRASHYLETYDEEIHSEPFRQGIHTAPPFVPEALDLTEALAEIETEALRYLIDGKFLAALGGEHSLTHPLARAMRTVWEEVGVVQFDAHADLRESYEGTPHSHASVMHGVVADGFPTLALGIRSLSTPEAEMVRTIPLPLVWGHELERLTPDHFAELLAPLPERVYLTFDLDYFDPALIPATGTPEPGGGWWYPTLALLRTLFRRKRVVSMDVVELAPLAGLPASDFLAAKLVYKCLGYLQEAEAS
jgi:agmatinase